MLARKPHMLLDASPPEVLFAQDYIPLGNYFFIVVHIKPKRILD